MSKAGTLFIAWLLALAWFVPWWSHFIHAISPDEAVGVFITVISLWVAFLVGCGSIIVWVVISWEQIDGDAT